jgi:para-nitrobenzyl esterase
MLGWTKDEMHAWFAQDAAMVAAETLDDLARFPAANGLPAVIRAPVSALIAKGLSPWEALGEVMTVRVFGGVAQSIADSRAAKGCDTYLYRFDWRPTRNAQFGACHCIEIPFMFDNFDDWPVAPMLEGGDPDSMKRVTDAVQTAWIAFIRTGKPGWPTRSQASRAVMVFDEATRLIDL